MGFKMTARILLAAAFFPGSYASSQTATPTQQRPKIGLVLEGGGALGLAHIGVLQWLEEHRIPVSYVAGTSMGGLVGGMYATGRSASGVRTEVQSIHWNDVLRGVTPYQNLAFRRKEDESDFPSFLEMGLKKGLSLPAGFNSGQEVSFILDRIALPYSEIKSFNDLPIPFACVGTDLATGKEYVFRRGSLSLALRSTMSLPGIFTPVRTDGHIFADGGLVNNLPVDVAKDMGADIVIAVYLQTKPLDPAERLSSFGVLGRAVSVIVAANEVISMEKADLLITVPLFQFNSSDYNQADSLIKAGYDAAQSKAALLSALSVDEPAWLQYLKDRDARVRTVPTPQFVYVAGADPRSVLAIQRQLASQVGKPVDNKKLQENLLDINGVGRYSNVNYSMTERNRQQGLLIQAEEKQYSPPSLRPLILIDGSRYNNVRFSLGARITFLDVGGYRAEWRNDIIVGSEYGLVSEYYRPFRANSNWFIAPRITTNSNVFNAYNDKGRLVSEYRKREGGGGFDVGYDFGRTAELRVGYETQYVDYSLQVGNPNTEPVFNGRQGSTQVKYSLLRVNDAVIPTSGQLVRLRTNRYDSNPGGFSSFTLSEGRAFNFTPIGSRSAVYISAGGGTTYGNNTVGVPVFSLGGTSQLPAYGTNEVLTNEYVSFEVGYLRQLAVLPPLLGDKLYFQARFETARVTGVLSGSRVPTDVAGNLIVNTIFGPILLGGAVGDAGHHKVFFGMGRVF